MANIEKSYRLSSVFNTVIPTGIDYLVFMCFVDMRKTGVTTTATYTSPSLLESITMGSTTSLLGLESATNTGIYTGSEHLSIYDSYFNITTNKIDLDYIYGLKTNLYNKILTTPTLRTYNSISGIKSVGYNKPIGSNTQLLTEENGATKWLLPLIFTHSVSGGVIGNTTKYNFGGEMLFNFSTDLESTSCPLYFPTKFAHHSTLGWVSYPILNTETVHYPQNNFKLNG